MRRRGNVGGAQTPRLRGSSGPRHPVPPAVTTRGIGPRHNWRHASRHRSSPRLAVAVTASADHKVVDRRRIELIEPDVATAPIHHEGGPHLLHRTTEPLDDDALAALVAGVRASVVRATSAALNALATDVAASISSMSLRAWPADFPEDIAIQRRVPYESQADSVMYRQVLAGLAHDRGWAVYFFDARHVEAEAARVLGKHADEVLHGPRASLGPPWSKEHRTALAATIMAP